jgi:hypothetical protein
MRTLMTILALFAALPALGQTCAPASTATPQPANEARVSWQRPATYADGTALPTTVALTYTLYRRTGTSGSFAALCTTTATSTALASQPVGQQFYTVTAKTATSGESAQATPPGSKTIADPPPGTPTNITVVSNRVEPESWTCRDEAGVIISSHQRQDKAQEACTNQAIAALLAGSAQQSPPFEMRSSAYRIVARR